MTLKIRDTVRFLFVLALGLWLGGAGCLACCEGRVGGVRAADHGAAARALAADAEGASAATHCPAHATQRGAASESAMDVAGGDSAHESSVASPARAGEAVPCCRRAGQVAEHARKPRAAPQPPDSTESAIARLARTRAASGAEMPARMFLPDRGGTHARLCVLLI